VHATRVRTPLNTPSAAATVALAEGTGALRKAAALEKTKAAEKQAHTASHPGALVLGLGLGLLLLGQAWLPVAVITARA